MKPTCLNCKDRYIGCHSECDRYKEWRVKHLAIKEREQLKKDNERISIIKGRRR